jgi:hypothetical protein
LSACARVPEHATNARMAGELRLQRLALAKLLAQLAQNGPKSLQSAQEEPREPDVLAKLRARAMARKLRHETSV